MKMKAAQKEINGVLKVEIKWGHGYIKPAQGRMRKEMEARRDEMKAGQAE